MNFNKVPQSETENRISRFQQMLCARGISLALIRQNADLYYFSGTVQDAHLFIPAEGKPVMLVWRSLSRAADESPLENIMPLEGLSRLADAVKDAGINMDGTLGLEMDVLPAFFYNFYTDRAWPGAKAYDISPLIRETRAIKSQWEIDQIRAACRQVAEAVETVPHVLKPGVTELELAAAVETKMRISGHPGYTRMRGWNQELGYGQFLSGGQGALPSWTNTPGGGQGVNPAFGISASSRRIQAHEPVIVDLGGSVNGYLCDQTRLFSIGDLPDHLKKASDATLELQLKIEEQLKPGTISGTIYDYALDFMSQLDYQAHFMGTGRDQVPFVGHGLGIEIDEYPFLARGNRMELCAGMVVAVEPKLIFPGEGLIGIEDTFLITEQGAERLTLSPQELRQL